MNGRDLRGESFQRATEPAEKMHAAFVVFPRFTTLDLAGPHDVIVRTGIRCTLVAETQAPVRSDGGLEVVPDDTFETCSAADILVVPGGPGQTAAMANLRLLTFLREQASTAKIVAGICTGVLLLAAAGPAKGKCASTHWLAVEELARLGATPSGERVTRDGNLYTSAGVTSGIDLAILLARDLFGDSEAKRIILAMEYDPEPLFDGGSAHKADPSLVDALRVTSRFHQKRRTGP